ncbi:MAG: hypothetical protein RLZZ480_233 [Candidatus Parcubacteria bacterium]|jgi:ABC-type multidrug transport system fused ATPase/permease subunit
MNIKFQKDGYVARVLTWGMPHQKKVQYMNRLQDGCPMFWRFVFMFVWSLGGLRKDHSGQSMDEAHQPQKRDKTMVRINAAVSDFSETKAAQVIGKGVGIFLTLCIIAIIMAVVFAIGTMIYEAFMGNWTNILPVIAVIVAVVAFMTIVILISEGMKRLGRWIKSTEPWWLFVQKVKSVKRKTCPVVSFA